MKRVIVAILSVLLVLGMTVSAVADTGNAENQVYYRHPLYAAADTLKAGLISMGFQLIDNGEANEIEESGVTFATWEEPKDLFGWQDDPIAVNDGAAIMRTRLLPAQLDGLSAASGELRIAAFGRVYDKTSEESYMRTQIEGLIYSRKATDETLSKFWDAYAAALYGFEGTSELTPVGTSSYAISVTDPATDKTYALGYVGPATEQTKAAVGIAAEETAWVFVLDVDNFAVQEFGLADRGELYRLDLAFLKQFTSDKPAVGSSSAYKAVDLMRKMGYVEVCGDVFYNDNAYVKMNMIQDEWDSNNKGVELVEPIGDLTRIRTVMTPALEEALAVNYANGEEEVKLFEVGHITSEVEDSVMPDERVSLCFMAYGPDVTMESFTAEVEDLIAYYGWKEITLITTEVAIAYNNGQCHIILNGAYETPGNFGPISEIATKNHGIGTDAYMANLEIRDLAK